MKYLKGLSMVELFVLILLAGFILAFIGVVVIMLAAIKEALKSGCERRTEAGGVVVIGPVPIVFGTSTKIAKAMLVLAIALTIVVLITYLILVGAIRWWS